MSAARLNVRDATGGRRREPVVGGGSIKRLLAIAAFIAVWRYRIGVIPVVLACAVVGIADTLLG